VGECPNPKSDEELCSRAMNEFPLVIGVAVDENVELP
jgi:hypothetical protein